MCGVTVHSIHRRKDKRKEREVDVQGIRHKEARLLLF